MTKPRILVTNDDGIRSPAIWKMAESLAAFAEVTIVAPSEQHSGAGRSYTGPDGDILKLKLDEGSPIHEAYSIGGTPAKAVVFGIYQLFEGNPPDLVVSGINYGENPGGSITSSGTVGAAMEAAVNGIPALAVSRGVPEGEYLSHSEEYDFSTAAYFTAQFAKKMLFDDAFRALELLKIDVPAEATPETPCKITRLSRYRYFEPLLRRDADGKRFIDYTINRLDQRIEPGDDVHGLVHEKLVTVTPLTMDMTAAVDFSLLEKRMLTPLE